MKKILVLLLALSSLSAIAAGSYNCNISVTQNEKLIGRIMIEQRFGMSAGRLYTLPLSKKKNLFGKTVEEVEVVLSGLVQSGTDQSEASLEGDISIHKTTTKRTVKTEKTLIMAINGYGDFAVDASASGLEVKGDCVYKL